jgi:hypothetical protein
MVLAHMSSKEIARALNISRHTVDQRLKVAMRILGAANRLDAARILAAAEEEAGYQPLVHQLPDVDRSGSAPPGPVPALEERNDDPQVDRVPGRRFGWMVITAAAGAVGLTALLIGLQVLDQLTR